MDDKKMEIIQQLMEELQDQMQYGEDDLGDRLGRKKPDVEIMKMGIDGKDDPMMDDHDGDEDMPGGMGHGMDRGMMMDAMNDDPEENLKNRLMKLRG